MGGKKVEMWQEGSTLHIDGLIDEPTPDEIKRRKSHTAKCGHVMRRIYAGEPLTGNVLEAALDAIDYSRKGKADEFLEGIAGKLTKGENLTEYEAHVMEEGVMLMYRTKGEI